MKKRFILSVIMLLILLSSPLLLSCQQSAREPTLISSPTETQLPTESPVKVLNGPDPNAIYLQLKVGEPDIIALPPEYKYWEEGEVLIRTKNFNDMLSPGNPMIPYQLYHLALPPDVDPNNLRIEITRVVEEKFPSLYRVAPAPPNVPCGDPVVEVSLDEKDIGIPPIEMPPTEVPETEEWGPGKEIVDGRNILIYEKDTLYPAENCQITYGGQLRKWRVATVAFYPVRYNPVKSEIFWVREIDLKIGFERDSAYLKKPGLEMILRDKVFDDRAKEIFLNYDRAKQWYQEPLLVKPEDDKNGKDNPDPDYAIITTANTFASADSLDDFCFHKEDLGYEVIVVTENETLSVEGNSVTTCSFAELIGIGGYENVIDPDPPGERPDKVRKWLQDNYVPLGIKYVLLVGNPDPDNAEEGDLVGDMPMKDCQLHIDADVPTDFYFAELTGDWDLDDDGLAGEYYDTTSGMILSIPAGITNKSQFSVRWEGVLEVEVPVINTTLTANTTLGTGYYTNLEVADSTGFYYSHYIRIGVPGAPDTEIRKVLGVDTNLIRVMGLSNIHPVGTPVETEQAQVLIYPNTEGNTQVWLDEGVDGLDAGDVVCLPLAEHRPYMEPHYETALPSGLFPVRIEYTQSEGDAYCVVSTNQWYPYDNVSRRFKHDDGTGIYVDGLEADFFNNDTFSGVPIPSTGYSPFITEYIGPKLKYAAAGDRGPGGVEFFPEVIVGRIPCYDEDQDGTLDYEDMNAILEKIITYENAPIGLNGWRRSVLTSCPYVADSDDADSEYDIAKYEWSEMLRDGVASPPVWDWYRIYEEPYPGVVPPAESDTGCNTNITQAAWNDPSDPDDGRGVVMWMSHGWQAASIDVFEDSQCSELDDTKPSIVFMGACSNGQPEFYSAYYLPLGYANLKSGAVSTVSATRTSYG